MTGNTQTKMLILGGVIALLVVPAAYAAGNAQSAPLNWDKTFGKRGSVAVPSVKSFTNAMGVFCTTTRDGGVSVHGYVSRSKPAAVKYATSKISRTGEASRWKLSKPGGSGGYLSPLADGSALVGTSTRRSDDEIVIRRILASGGYDKRFGKGGYASIPEFGESLSILPLDNSDYLLVLDDSRTSRLFRYSVRGKRRLEFGGTSGVVLNGRVSRAARDGADNSIYVVSSITGQTPSTSLIRLTTNGELDGTVAPAGWMNSFGVRPDASITDLGLGGGIVYATVSQRTTAGQISSPTETRIVGLSKLGVPVSTTGVALSTPDPGDRGDPLNAIHRMAVTESGVVLYRMTRQINRFAQIHVSRWPLGLGVNPISSIASTQSTLVPPSRRPFFGATNASVSRDGRFMYVCGNRVTGLSRSGTDEVSSGVIVRRVRL